MFMCCLQRGVVFALTTVLFSTFSKAQNASYCVSTEHTAANATGSLEIAGFQPFIDTHIVQNSTWTISTGINQIEDLNSNSYYVEQHFWLDTQPVINTSPADLPYTGCALLLTGFSSPRISTGTNSSNSCNGVFDTDCYNAIVGTVDTFLLESIPGSIEDVCQLLLVTPPSQCKNYAWTTTTATRKSQNLSMRKVIGTDPEILLEPFGNPSFSNGGNSSCTGNVFNGTEDLIFQTSETTSPLSNYTTYDSWVKQATPLFLAAFTKNVTDQTPRWGATNLLCLTANDVNSGSRIPTTSGVVRNVVVGKMVMGFTVLGILAGLGFL